MLLRLYIFLILKYIKTNKPSSKNSLNQIVGPIIRSAISTKLNKLESGLMSSSANSKAR